MHSLWKTIKSRLIGLLSAEPRAHARSGDAKLSTPAARKAEKETATNQKTESHGATHNSSGAQAKTSAAQRLAMLQAVARKKNGTPPHIRPRAFDHTRVTQLRIKRYTRSR